MRFSHTADEPVASMLKTYPKAALPVILDFAAKAAGAAKEAGAVKPAAAEGKAASH